MYDSYSETDNITKSMNPIKQPENYNLKTIITFRI